MKQILALVIAVFFASLAVAETEGERPLEGLIESSETADLSKFLWTNRLIIVFADTANDPRFIEQMRLLESRPEALATRDVRIFVDTAPEASGPLRETYHPRGFMMLLVGKDGQVYLRKPQPWDVREITRSIDKMPLRQQEIRERR